MLARVALLAVAAWLGWQAFDTLSAYRAFRAVADRLPDLPPVQGAPALHRAAFPMKIWLHRVNSVQRAKLMATRYRGLEVDVTYDAASDSFDVGHPPEPSIGLSLDRLLAAVPDIANHYFWIDFKNLTEANAPAACSHMLALGKQYGIVDHMIVESVNPTALACFTENGFHTSYYLFPEVSLPDMTPEQCAAYYAEVKASLAASNVTDVSMSYESLPFVERYFPDANVLLWYRDHARNVRYYSTLAYLTSRSRVQVVLVRELSPGYR